MTLFHKVILTCVCLSVAACAGEREKGSEKSETGYSAEAGELWDTNLAYGRTIEIDATGLDRGEQAFNRNCAICHSTGVGMVGTETIQRRYMKAGIDDMSPVLLERTDLTPGFVELVVRNGMNSMAPFRISEITNEDLFLIGEYLAQNNPDYEGE